MLPEHREDAVDPGPDAGIRILRRATLFVLHVAAWWQHRQLPARRLGLPAGMHAMVQGVEFGFAHGSSDAKQETVVGAFQAMQ